MDGLGSIRCGCGGTSVYSALNNVICINAREQVASFNDFSLYLIHKFTKHRWAILALSSHEPA
jgi:hypothetical protein